MDWPNLLGLLALFVLIELARLGSLPSFGQDLMPSNGRGVDGLVLPVHTELVAASLGDFLAVSHAASYFDDFNQFFVFHRDSSGQISCSTFLTRFIYRKCIELVEVSLKYAV